MLYFSAEKSKQLCLPNSKEFNVKRHDQTKHANVYDKLRGRKHTGKSEATPSCFWPPNSNSSHGPVSQMNLSPRRGMKLPCYSPNKGKLSCKVCFQGLCHENCGEHLP